MLSPVLHPPSVQTQTVASGEILLRRAQLPHSIVYLESGRVALGVLVGDGTHMEHQLGEVEGPCWVEATAAVLGLPNAVDALADGEVELQRVPLADFLHAISDLTPAARAVLHDVALAHRHQTELAVSRLAKDAEARCAEWLLRHAEPSQQGTMAVQLHERKRAIAAQLGIAPETFSRVLRHLRERSLISGSGRTLQLDDPHGLEVLAGA